MRVSQRSRRRRFKNTRQSQSNTFFSSLSLARCQSFLVLTWFWLKHSLFQRLSRPVTSDRKSRSNRRERIYVDASFTHGDKIGGNALGGIGVWVPSQRIAIALKVAVKTSMEAETLALLAGAIVAKRLRIERPIIFSDCKFAVQMATRHMHVGRSRGLAGKLTRLFQLAGEHRAFRHIYDTLSGVHGTLEWRPREDNREADLASNIGSRLGNMGILLSGNKNQNHALNDVLSLALDAHDEEALEHQAKGGLVRRRYRGGTRTVSMASNRPTPSRHFLRDAKHLIANISAEVA